MNVRVRCRVQPNATSPYSVSAGCRRHCRQLQPRSPSRTTSHDAGTTPTPGTSRHAECQPGTPRVSSSCSSASRRRSVAATTASARSIASSMASSTAAMARCSGRGGRRRERARVASRVKPKRVTPFAARAKCLADAEGRQQFRQKRAVYQVWSGTRQAQVITGTNTEHPWHVLYHAGRNANLVRRL